MTKALAKSLSPEAQALLAAEFPAEPPYGEALRFPRISFKSQDVIEGRGKTAKVVIEAGTYFDEYETDEVDAEGKKVWNKVELGKELEVVILYKRRQLRFFDESTDKFISTPVFDDPNEVLPLFASGEEIARGTQAELQAKYPGFTKAGKPKSDLEENVVLYVLHKADGDDEAKVKMLTIRGSSMYNFKTYARKTVVPTVLTALGSEERENGTVVWNAMTFKAVRPITEEEAQGVLSTVQELKEAIANQKAAFADKAPVQPQSALAGEFDDDDLPRTFTQR